jgi:hypothetical protein
MDMEGAMKWAKAWLFSAIVQLSRHFKWAYFLLKKVLMAFHRRFLSPNRKFAQLKDSAIVHA